MVKSNVIAIYCDGGGKKVILVDSHLSRNLFARISNHAKYVGEYRAILFALKYIAFTYKHRDIVVLTDGKSEADVLNGNSYHNGNKIKEFSDNVKLALVAARTDNIVNIIWLPRNQNIAGIYLQKFYNVKHKALKKTIEQVDYEFLVQLKDQDMPIGKYFL